jgi:hypothetical protein
MTRSDFVQLLQELLGAALIFSLLFILLLY